MEFQDIYWKALTTPGNWIYSTTEKEMVRLNCRHTTKQFEINNSGIISVQQGCKIRARTATMSHPAYQTTTFAQHFIPQKFNILELYKPIQREYKKINFTKPRMWITNHSNIEASFNDIIEKARQIKERKLQNSRFITYSAATCSIGLLGILCSPCPWPEILGSVMQYLHKHTDDPVLKDKGIKRPPLTLRLRIKTLMPSIFHQVGKTTTGWKH
ncbi:hypothetical protein P5V15_012215 [Pogonomyrmex californicus]